MDKTVSVRMDKQEYAFITRLAEEENEDVSKALRELVEQGRLMAAVKQYKEGRASLGRAAKLAGISISELLNVLSEFNIPSRLDYEDFEAGLANMQEEW